MKPLETRPQVLAALRPYRALLVAGPQRSGTTIAAIMLARDLGLKVKDETKHVNVLQTVASMLNRGDRVVLQAPEMSLYLHLFPPMEDVAVVWMLRPSRDVIASQDRIGWTELYEDGLARQYRKQWPDLGDGRLCDLRLKAWRKHQRHQLQLPSYELRYVGPYVQNHELYVAQEHRAGWHAKRTTRSWSPRSEPWSP